MHQNQPTSAAIEKGTRQKVTSTKPTMNKADTRALLSDNTRNNPTVKDPSSFLR